MWLHLSSGSIQFDVSGSGEIQRVYYAKEEDPVGLNLKKTLLGTLSSKLVVSDSQRAAGSRWAYRVNETGHEGWSIFVLLNSVGFYCLTGALFFYEAVSLKYNRV